MTDIERAVLNIADTQGVLDYYRCACDNGWLDPKELQEDIDRMDKTLQRVLDYLHSLNEKETINNSVQIERSEEPKE